MKSVKEMDMNGKMLLALKNWTEFNAALHKLAYKITGHARLRSA